MCPFQVTDINSSNPASGALRPCSELSSQLLTRSWNVNTELVTYIFLPIYTSINVVTMSKELREQILDSPVLRVPDDVQPNFVNPPSLRNSGLEIPQLILRMLVMWIRLDAKVRPVQKMLVEDCESF